MNEQLKNLAWAAIPPQARAEARREFEFYFRKGKYDATTVLDHIFGGYNLTSDTEPEEMVFARRFEVLWRYEEYTSGLQVENLVPELRGYNRGAQTVLRLLFGDKCLPDQPEQKPTPTDLAPYPEPEPQQTEEDMEDKELNLAELLLKYNADKIYLVDEGEVELVEIIDKLAVDVKGVDGRPIGLRGETLEIKPTGFAYIYPSKESFLKYPLNAKQAWQIWAEERKPKRDYRVEISWQLIQGCTHGCSVENVTDLTKDEAYELHERIKSTIEQFRKDHEKNAEK